MSDLFDDLDFEMLGGDFEDPFENEPVDPMPPPVPGMPNAGHQPVQHPKAAVQKASEADCTEGPAQHRILAPPHQASAEAFTNAEAQVTKADDNAADTAAYQEEVSNQTGPEQIPTLNMMVSLADQTEAAAAQQDTRTLMELPPVFKYGSCEEDISDGDMTFEQLRAEKEPDFLELEDSKRVSWTVQYGRVTKPISSPAKQKIAQVKEEIELSKEFLEGLKKAKDKRPRCFVKPTVAGKSKGIAAYKAILLSPEDAANKDATIAKYEKESKRVKVAMENGIPYELAGKLSGETEDEMKKDAEAFSKFLKGKTTYPNFTRDTDNKDDSIREATKKMLNNLKGE